MAKSKKYSKKNRAWLNSNQTMRASVLWHVSGYWEDWEGWPDYMECEFSVGDCLRHVTIDCSYHNAKAKKAGLAKIDKMMAELVKFRKAVADAPGRAAPKKKKKKKK